MEYSDQYIAVAPQHPCFQVQPPTPVTASGPQSTFVIPATSPVAIPPCSRPSSRNGTSASSLSRSASRHHPYGASPASFASSYSERSFRPRSATSTSERSEWESEASAYETDCDSRFNNSPELGGFSSIDFPFFADASLPRPPPSSRPSPSPFARDAEPPRIGKNGKPKKSHARKTAPGHIKRPPNAFILFRSHCCAPKGDSSEPDPPGTAHARHLASLDINNSQHLSLIVSQLWKGLKPDERAYWEGKAQAAKEEHQRLHPDYRYKPVQRAKETIRKRKRPDPTESREHRDACHEVARIVLNQEGDDGREQAPWTPDAADLSLPVPPTRGRANLMDDVLDGAAAKRSAAKSRTTRRTTRRTRTQDSTSDDSSPPSLGLPTPPSLPDPFSTPNPAPYPSVLAGTDHFAPRSSPEHDNSPFAFMAQLDRESAKSSISPNSLFGVDPQCGVLSSTIDGQVLHPLSRPATMSAPSHFAVPTPTAPATAVGFSRPPSPTSEAIRQMQSYSLGGPSPPARSDTVLPGPPTTCASSAPEYSFGTYPSQSEPHVTPSLAQRRDVLLPPNLPLSALKHRRSTIRPGQQVDPNARADLMLISPLTTTFNGRRQSMGWSSGLRRVSLGLTAVANGGDGNTPALPYRKSSLSSGVLAGDTSFETLAFPQDVLESFPVENLFTDADFFSQFAPSTGLPIPSDDLDQERPGTASSSWSTDDSFEPVERLEGGFPAGFFDRRRSTIVASKFPSPESHSPNYHVDSTEFFSAPDPPLSTYGSHVSQPAVPAFGSAEFGGSFQPFEHRASIGSLLASSLASFDHNVTPTVPQDDDSNPFAPPEPEWTAASMKDTALSILRERRELPSPAREVSPAAPAECEYVLLPVEQLGDTELMTRLHQQGYGIAFETAPLEAYPDTSTHAAPSGAVMSFDDPHLSQLSQLV
ncbi:hypothetical protein JCM11491_002731 [Sporobolomyces phaffii]